MVQRWAPDTRTPSRQLVLRWRSGITQTQRLRRLRAEGTRSCLTGPVSTAASLLRWAPPINDLTGRRPTGRIARRRAEEAAKAHRLPPGRWLVSLRATSLGPEVDAWIVVIAQFATSMCRYVAGPTRSAHATAARTTASWVNTTTVA